jgi:hypothetical protein
VSAIGSNGPDGPATPDPTGGGAARGTGHGSRFRPSRWSWTTLASGLLIVALIFPITSAATALGPILEPTWAEDVGSGVGVPEVVGRGWLLAAVPSALVILAAWRFRRRGHEGDLRSAAALGLASVAVLGVGVLIGLLGLPQDPEPRLVLLTALFVVGAVLLGASLWVRHVPRP